MKNNFFTRFNKLFLALLISFIISSFFIKHIFLANSPKIRSNLDSYFLAKIKSSQESIIAYLRFNLFRQKIDTNNLANYSKEQINQYLKNNLKPITKGIKAATLPGYGYTEYKLNEIEWVQIEYTLKDGRKIKINFPKGTTPPPEEIFE